LAQGAQQGDDLGVRPRRELAVFGAARCARQQLQLDQLAPQQAMVTEVVVRVEDLVDFALAVRG
jgi:hypothetical protein